jgi:hypothetical protein
MVLSCFKMSSGMEPNKKIGGHRQHGNRENQGNLVGGQHF